VRSSPITTIAQFPGNVSDTFDGRVSINGVSRCNLVQSSRVYLWCSNTYFTPNAFEYIGEIKCVCASVRIFEYFKYCDDIWYGNFEQKPIVLISFLSASYHIPSASQDLLVVVKWLTILLRVRERQCSKLGLNTGYSDRGFSWFSSVSGE
jgi:hypothetical protein